MPDGVMIEGPMALVASNFDLITRASLGAVPTPAYNILAGRKVGTIRRRQ
jgi:hypothetical protein